MNGPKKTISKLRLPTTITTSKQKESSTSNGPAICKRRTVLAVKNVRKSRNDFDMPSRTRNKLVGPKLTTIKKTYIKPVTTTIITETKASTTRNIKQNDNVQNIPPKTNRPRAAPYDFKTKFNYMKEDHNNLKVVFTELKEKQQSIVDQNEELVIKNVIIQTELNYLKELYNSTKEKLDKIEFLYDTVVDHNKILERDNHNLRSELNTTTKQMKLNTEELSQIKQEFIETKKSLLHKTKALGETQDLIEILKDQLNVFDKKQREMHNVIQELKGNIRVFCRIRPVLLEEKQKKIYGVNYIDEKSIELLKYNKKSEFSFDKVFGPNVLQEDIFEELAQLVQSALDGYNVCIFAYGQTGSGKTYTMDGIGNSANQLGMIPRSVDLIFTIVEQLQKLGWAYIIKTSFLEIYNENIVDLLDLNKTQLDIRIVDNKSNDVYVTNLSVMEVKNADELKYHLNIAQKNRATAATENNERSSRSHSVAKVILEGFNKHRNEKCVGSLNLVDLAGSEKFSTNETVRLRETTNINKSLSTLNSVILALGRKNVHVPYRNSKLTHLLMPCLGGNSKTLMFVNISPLEECFLESVNSLKFATTVNQCKTASIKKIKTMHYSYS